MHGFEERLTTDIYPADFGWTPDWAHPDQRPSWYHNMGSVIEAGPCIRTNQLDFDEEVVFAAQQKLFDIARDKDDRPFCMLVSPTHPHDPYAIPEQYWNLYRDEEIDMPRVSLAPQELDPHSQRLRRVSDMDRAPPTEQQIRNARHAYYGAVSYVDEQIGRIRRTLEQSGMAEDTVIIVLADHGDMLGERGLWYKMNFFEPASRIPLIVMIRRGRYKFIHSPADPDQLYELAGDPDELNNLCSDPASVEIVQAFRKEVASRWDLTKLRAEVIASQKRRRFHFEAQSMGRRESWDYQAQQDASQRFMRNHIDLDTLEARARFPVVGEI